MSSVAWASFWHSGHLAGCLAYTSRAQLRGSSSILGIPGLVSDTPPGTSWAIIVSLTPLSSTSTWRAFFVLM